MTRYWWICCNSSSEAVQITSWQVATRMTSEPLSKAYNTSSMGNSVNRSLPHLGHTTGNLTVGSIITHLASCLDMGDTSETRKIIRDDLTQSAVNSVGKMRDRHTRVAQPGQTERVIIWGRPHGHTYKRGALTPILQISRAETARREA